MFVAISAQKEKEVNRHIQELRYLLQKGPQLKVSPFGA
ncbi:unnamed protein product [Anisakis simplex]|uniref:ELL domain-containing protein n=1 Tax=Anisakis simplex TaxID=6269 RepID=A0A0M3KJ34_ANISI|nr:unnamed protein product [Anisakis simplex]